MSERKWNRKSAERALRRLQLRTRQYRDGNVRRMYNILKENAVLDGVRVIEEYREDGNYGVTYSGSEVAGSPQKFRENTNVPIRYDISLHNETSYEFRFGVLLHELAHLYCGHVGKQIGEWWSDLSNMDDDPSEVEAESIAHLVCRHLDIDNYSRQYLSSYIGKQTQYQLPREDSLDRIVKVANYIEERCNQLMSPEYNTRWLDVDIVLLDGVITFLIPKPGLNIKYAQDKFTSRSPKMEGPIKLWYIQAENHFEWQSIVQALKRASHERRISPTVESRRRIDKITKTYEEGNEIIFNQAREVTESCIDQFERDRLRILRRPRLRIHIMMRDSIPGLIVLKEHQPINSRLKFMRGWHDDKDIYLYKMVENKVEARCFLDALERDGWKLLGYASGKNDVRDTLELIQDSE